VELTDSAYVVCNMHIMTRVGGKVIDLLNKNGDFIQCLHSLGAPLAEGAKGRFLALCPDGQEIHQSFPG